MSCKCKILRRAFTLHVKTMDKDNTRLTLHDKIMDEVKRLVTLHVM